MVRTTRSSKGGNPATAGVTKITLPGPVGAENSWLINHPSKWGVQSSNYTIRDGHNKGKIQDMSVEINPATATSKEIVNVTSCNGTNLSASAVYQVPFTDNCYMSFKIDPITQADANKYCPNVQYLSNDPSPGANANKPDGTLKNCMIGFIAVDKDMFEGRGATPADKANDLLRRPRWIGDMVQLFGHAFRVRGHIGTAYYGKENYGPTVVRGDGPMTKFLGQPDMRLPAFNRDMVFTITYTRGMMNYFVNDVLVDQKAFSLPGGKALFAYYDPLELPSGPQRIVNFSVGSLLTQAGGNMPDCTTYCDPTKVYRASSARVVEQQASSARAQQASSARVVERQASSARAQAASSAVVQGASSAYAEKMKYYDTGKTLAKTLVDSLSQGQKLGTPVVTPLQPSAQGALKAMRAAQAGGRRRRGKKTRKMTRRR